MSAGKQDVVMSEQFETWYHRTVAAIAMTIIRRVLLFKPSGGEVGDGWDSVEGWKGTWVLGCGKNCLR